LVFFEHLVNSFRFWKSYQEKSGNPGCHALLPASLYIEPWDPLPLRSFQLFPVPMYVDMYVCILYVSCMYPVCTYVCNWDDTFCHMYIHR
jgi:hypothetical protein